MKIDAGGNIPICSVLLILSSQIRPHNSCQLDNLIGNIKVDQAGILAVVDLIAEVLKTSKNHNNQYDKKNQNQTFVSPISSPSRVWTRRPSNLKTLRLQLSSKFRTLTSSNDNDNVDVKHSSKYFFEKAYENLRVSCSRWYSVIVMIRDPKFIPSLRLVVFEN